MVSDVHFTITVFDVDSEDTPQVLRTTTHERPWRKRTIYQLLAAEDLSSLNPGRTYSAHLWRTRDGRSQRLRRGLRFHLVPAFNASAQEDRSYKLTPI